jgi:hypothetical protein
MDLCIQVVRDRTYQMDRFHSKESQISSQDNNNINNSSNNHHFIILFLSHSRLINRLSSMRTHRYLILKYSKMQILLYQSLDKAINFYNSRQAITRFNPVEETSNIKTSNLMQANNYREFIQITNIINRTHYLTLCS